MLTVAVVIVAVAVVVTLAVRHFSGSSDNDARALQQQAALARTQAASWVVKQVARNDSVACDETMCATLRADGFPSGELVVLGPTSNPPLTSAVVVATATIRYIFGSSLSTAWAPGVLATFGSGNAEISVRVMAPHGAVAYQAELSADLASRKASESSLLGNGRITISNSGQNQLTAGQVDPRLFLAIASLAKDQPIEILAFGNVGTGASASMPLRFADLSVTDPAGDLNSSAYIAALRTGLTTINAQYRPTSSELVPGAGGQSVFRIEFTAPSPLGVFQP
jgi:hypothetical protein